MGGAWIEARRQLLEELRDKINSCAIVSTLQRFKSSEQDGRDDLRQTALSIVAGIMDNDVAGGKGSSRRASSSSAPAARRDGPTAVSQR
jgi:hypothetical protein